MVKFQYDLNTGMNSLIHSWMNMNTVKGWGILEFFLDPAIRFELPISCHWSLLILPENIRKPEVSQKRSKAWNGLKSSIVGYIHKIKNQEIYRDLLLSEKEQNFEGYSFTALLKRAKIEDYIDHMVTVLSGLRQYLATESHLKMLFISP